MRRSACAYRRGDVTSPTFYTLDVSKQCGQMPPLLPMPFISCSSRRRKALTGREPRIIELSDGEIVLECGREHLNGFARYAELADAIEKWLEETDR